MMVRSLINFGQALSQTGGVNIRILDSDTYDISCCVLNQKKGLVSIASLETDITSFDALKAKLQDKLFPNAQLHINLEGAGILTKVADTTAVTGDKTVLVKKLFPMIKMEEFTIQNFTLGTQNYFAAVRNDVFEKCNLLASHFTITSVSLGPFIAASLGPVLKSNVVKTDRYTLSFSDGKLSSVSDSLPMSDNDDVIVGDDRVPAKATLAYAAALSILMPVENLEVQELPWVQNSVSKYSFYKVLYLTSRVALGSLLGVLLLNALIFFWLQSETQEMQFQESLYSGKKNETDARMKKVSALSSAYEKIGWESNQLPLYYADQIGQNVTPDIQLSLLDIGILDESILKKEKKQVFQPGVIKVKGYSNSPLSLKNWIETIERLGWVKNIADQKYQYDSKLAKGVFEFYIYVR